MLRHPSLDDLESSTDEKLTYRSITFHCSTNWQHWFWEFSDQLLVSRFLILHIYHTTQLMMKTNTKCGIKTWDAISNVKLNG